MNVRRYNENDGAGKRRLLSVCTSWRSVPSSVLLDTRNSLSNSPCPLGSARGRGRYNLLARAINNKPFQCSDRRKSPQRRCSAARVEQGDLFNFYARSRSLISAQFWDTKQISSLSLVLVHRHGYVQVIERVQFMQHVLLIHNLCYQNRWRSAAAERRTGAIAESMRYETFVVYCS